MRPMYLRIDYIQRSLSAARWPGPWRVAHQRDPRIRIIFVGIGGLLQKIDGIAVAARRSLLVGFLIELHCFFAHLVGAILLRSANTGMQ